MRPKHARDAERINPLASPPRGFIAAAMEFAVVEAAHRNGDAAQFDDAFARFLPDEPNIRTLKREGM